MKSLALVLALLALGCNTSSLTGPGDPLPFSVEVVAGDGSIAVVWIYSHGCPRDPDPDAVKLNLEGGIKKAYWDTGDYWQIPGVSVHFENTGRDRNGYMRDRDTIVAKCGREDVLWHEVGHPMALRAGLPFWSTVWHCDGHLMSGEPMASCAP